jgi:hypothetical protein
MKTKKAFVLLSSLLFTKFAFSQGMLIYDQQSSTNTGFGGGLTKFNSYQPMGQSFTPTLSSVDFVQLQFADLNLNSLGAVAYVNLLENSITGTVLTTSSPVAMSDGFRGVTTFFFPSPAAVVAGLTYYFQPVLQSGDAMQEILIDYYNYPGGTSFFFGAPSPDSTDLWFREGIVVPEPASLSLLLMGIGSLWLLRRTKTPIA